MIGDTAQHVGEPSLGVDAIEFGRGDQGVDRGSAFAAAVGAGKQPCSAPEGSRPVILPMSSRTSRSIIVGTHSMGAAFGANMSSGAPAATSFMSRWHPA